MPTPRTHHRDQAQTRSPEQISRHYQIERELATALKNASKGRRGALYSETYDELFRRVHDHPQLFKKASSEERSLRVRLQMGLLQRWLTPQAVFLEIGAGDCALSFAVAPQVAHVYAVDVSDSITRAETAPPNFTLALSDGTNIPVPDGSITLAYSNQLMEHLHPDDAFSQLTNIYRALAPGGIYVCLTPNRLSGPHDISRAFDEVATGLHLHEYTCAELTALFKQVGFKSVKQYGQRRDTYFTVPLPLMRSLEGALQRCPRRLRRLATRSNPVRGLLRIQLVARK